MKNRKFRQAGLREGLSLRASLSDRVAPEHACHHSFITFLTDFGLNDIYVGAMKGVVAGVNPCATVIDLCHDVPPHDIRTAAFLLAGSYSFFPPGTIHVAVVDPTVGSRRRALCVQAGRHFFVGPDNGVMSIACFHAGRPKVFLLENEAYFLQNKSRTFHGRDIFAPVAAHLAAGEPIESFGRRVRSMKRIRLPIPVAGASHTLQGEVAHIDRFGNLITNVRETDISKVFGGANRSHLIVACAAQRVSGVNQTYSDVAPGVALVLFGSYSFLEIAISNGNAASAFGVKRGDKVQITLKGR